MADREIRGRVTVDDAGASANLRKVADGTKKLGNEAKSSERKIDKLEDELDQLERSLGQAKRELSSFVKTGKGLSSMKTAFAGLGAAIAAVGIGSGIRAVSEGLREATEAAEKQIQAQQQIVQALESTQGAAGLSSEEIFKLAGSLQEVTRYGDEVVLEMQAVLLTFTNLGREIFPQVSEAVLNVATRMGTDLKSAAVQLGKALNDPVANLGALSRAGIQFSEDQQTLIKALVESGDLLGAQKIILAELEAQFGGAAKAARDAFGGSIDGAKNAVGDLVEKLGVGLGPALSAVADDVVEASKAGGELEKAFTVAGKVIGTVVIGLSAAFKQLVLDSRVVATGFTQALNPIIQLAAKFTAGLTDLVGVIPGMGKASEKSAAEIRGLASAFQDLTDNTLNRTAQAVGETNDALEQDFATLMQIWQGGADSVKQSAEDIGNSVNDLGNTIKDAGIGEATSEALGEAGAAWDSLRDSIQVVTQTVGESGEILITTTKVTKEAAAAMKLDELNDAPERLRNYAREVQAAADAVAVAGAKASEAAPEIKKPGDAAATAGKDVGGLAAESEKLAKAQEDGAAAAASQAESLGSMATAAQTTASAIASLSFDNANAGATSLLGTIEEAVRASGKLLENLQKIEDM